MSEKKITIYPAHSSNQQKAAKRRKLQVAAYCRVSTNSLEQKNSYKMQKAYYTQLIASHSEWKNAGIYADRGISGADMQSERTRRSLQKRKRSRKTKIATRKFSGKYALSDRLICGECGSIYRRCVWNVSGVRRTVWRCCSRLEFGKAYCHRSPTIEEAALHRGIVSAINQYIEKQRKSPTKTPPPKPLVTDDMNYSRHISEMQSDAQQFRFDEIKSWLSAHRDGIQCYDDQAVRLLVQKITVVSKDMISVKFYGRRGKIVVIL